MRKLYVPVSVTALPYADEYLKDFKELGVDHVFIAENARLVLASGEKYDAYLKITKQAVDFYTAQGIENGVWLSTLGYGASLGWGAAPEVQNFTQIRSVVGRDGGDAFCPLDENFVARVERTIGDLAPLINELRACFDSRMPGSE